MLFAASREPNYMKYLLGIVAQINERLRADEKTKNYYPDGGVFSIPHSTINNTVIIEHFSVPQNVTQCEFYEELNKVVRGSVKGGISICECKKSLHYVGLYTVYLSFSDFVWLNEFNKEGNH